MCCHQGVEWLLCYMSVGMYCFHNFDQPNSSTETDFFGRHCTLMKKGEMLEHAAY